MCHHFEARDDRRTMKATDMHSILQAVSVANDERCHVTVEEDDKVEHLTTFQEKIRIQKM